ncbi:sigma-54-dependent Fis family transcriptional regulator [Alkalilimnicola ehrlichii]|uniref:Sigma-54-dependent Fis family transcriptional regulator n=1 Tax=Alkalilimnicola ehrlichii TaxID=351052 RepID=A0A3E0X420_9GAMM|nr:sigma-54 dependent transcriptional regulator [Alkalilimnicola ehrlichii]RFA31303.1 sigma-54-dependent Fis family transcriptional regulator [Alkalilimnicola ehrlichii]RFA39425.1 sigma-54-dependent Fis family transcriptional regulator [Alkalilimnicola ehrlichii]
MSRPLALIVDDEPDIRELIQLTLQRMEIDTVTAANLTEARQILGKQNFSLCLTDMQLPDGNGIELVEHMRDRFPDIPVAVVTAHGSMDTAVQALKAGAFDFVAKPVDLAILRKLVDSAVKLTLSPAEDRRSRHTLLGESKPMQRIRSLIGKLARSQAPVYISGESGTGKELVAHLIHDKGPRRDKPFVPVNCGAIPAELMESEFFGHKKGSFTGANTDKQGLFQAADGGTLFLDEIAELPMHMQVKLLRAIQEKAIRPIGEQRETPIDVRILSATHKDLAQLVSDGGFRQDLYYRINVIQLPVPPLRERRDDIPALAEHFLKQLEADGAPLRLSSEAMKALCHYPFPGNVRELENVLERAVTLAEGETIQADDLLLPEAEVSAPQPVDVEPDEDFALEDYLGDIERNVIVSALEKANYNKTAAAKLLGISFRALRYRLKKLELE